MRSKYLNLSLVFCLVLLSLSAAYPTHAQYITWPPNPLGIWYDPGTPSIYDTVSFGLFDYVPPEWECHWDFGDGTVRDTLCWDPQPKQYNADGDYTVSVRVASAGEEPVLFSRVVSVRTHDVTITRFSVPTSARAGQTRQIVVNVGNSRYPEKVQVELYKNVYDYPPLGTLIQEVPPRPANRTTAFSFNYTFTAEDARIGKVTFMAMAFIQSESGDDWPSDNSAIAAPTRVSR